MTSARAETTRLIDLLRREHNALADFLVALAAFHAERRWIELGHSSLFYFLHRELGLSKGAAHYRKVAAELVQRYPEIVDSLREGRLCMTSLVELSKVITPENRAEVVPRFFHLSKREAQEVTAELLPVPAPPLRTVVTAVRAEAPQEPGRETSPGGGLLPALTPASAAAGPGLVNAEPAVHLANHPRASSTVHDVAVEPPRSPPQRTEVEPLTAELRRIHLTVSRCLLDKLAAARDALSHSHPGASEDEILEVGLDLILQRHAKRRGLVAKPRAPSLAPAPAPAQEVTATAPEEAAPGLAASTASAAPTAALPLPPPSKRSRYVRADVKRVVWKRDGGRCQWAVDGGGICGTTHRVEFDHILGWALGADSTVEELRLLCRLHQDVHARKLYGDDLMNTYTRPKGGGCSEPTAKYAASAPGSMASNHAYPEWPGGQSPLRSSSVTSRHPMDPGNGLPARNARNTSTTTRAVNHSSDFSGIFPPPKASSVPSGNTLLGASWWARKCRPLSASRRSSRQPTPPPAT